MPCKPRFFVADIPTHNVQRGNNRQAIFFADNDYRVYPGWIAEAAKRWNCTVHSYVLMANHVHLLVMPQVREGISRLMQYVGQRYVPCVNHEYGRTGALWECLQTATPLGSDHFHTRIEQALGRPVGFSGRGRSKKPVEEDDQQSRGSVKQLPLKCVGVT